MPFYGNVKRYGDSGGRIFASHLHFNWLWKGPAPWPATATYTGGSQEANDLAGPVDRHRRHDVPQGGGAGRLAGRGRRDPDARPDSALRLGALRGAGDAADAALDLPADEPELDEPADLDAIHDVQHAGRGGGRRAVRPRRPHRHPRQGGPRRRARARTSPIRARRHAVPDRVHVGDAVAPRRRRWSSCSSTCRRACSPTPTGPCRRRCRRPACPSTPPGATPVRRPSPRPRPRRRPRRSSRDGSGPQVLRWPSGLGAPMREVSRKVVARTLCGWSSSRAAPRRRATR